MPLQAKQLIRSSRTTSAFFVSSETQYNKNSCRCGQLVIGSFIMRTHSLRHHVSWRHFLVKHQITQVTQHPYSPIFSPCDFWLFPKLKSTLKGKRFQTTNEIWKIWQGSWWRFQQRFLQSVFNSERDARRTVWGPNMTTLKGPEVSLSYVQWFLYLISSSIHVSIFHRMQQDTFCTDLIFISKIPLSFHNYNIRIDWVL